MKLEQVCPEAASLSAMLNGTLAFDVETEVHEHVERCADCQKRLDELIASSGAESLPFHCLASVPGSEASRNAPSVAAALTEKVSPHVSPSKAQPSNGSRRLLEALPPSVLGRSSDPSALGRMGHYDVLEVVGRGGMGIVVKARDTRLQRIVAIKILTPELSSDDVARRRFLREARAAAAVSHDHIITIYAVEEEPVPYLVMELIDGRSLQDKIEQAGQLELLETLRIGQQIAAGLAAAHAHGLIHRDIKPANILLQNGIERVQITDFGLARNVYEAGITQTGEVAGTPQYMSPEQAQGLPVDPRSDLFSMGSVLYAMCAGRSPFRAESAVAVLRRVCDEAPRPIREINPHTPDWLAAIIARLLKKNASERFQSAGEVAQLLGNHLSGLQQGGAAPQQHSATNSPGHANGRAAMRGRWTWVGLGTVLVVVLAWLGVMNAPHRLFVPKGATGVDAQTTAAADATTDVPAGPAETPAAAIVPFDAAQARAHQVAWAKHLGVPVEYTNSIGMRLRLIPPGEFPRGSSPEELEFALPLVEGDEFWSEAIRGEGYLHRVQLTRPFYLGVYEITQQQYQTVMGHNPSFFSAQGGGQAAVDGLNTVNFPVELVSWNGAATFCSRLSERERLASPYVWIGDSVTIREGMGYRLPTEAEWEFACRAGTTTRYWIGATGEELGNTGWFGGNAGERTHAVGELWANPFGLHDVLGNVWEWCQDGYDSEYYKQFADQTAIDPTGPAADFSLRVIRGGCWTWTFLGGRSAARGAAGPRRRDRIIGLRVVLPVDAVQSALARPPPLGVGAKQSGSHALP